MFSLDTERWMNPLWSDHSRSDRRTDRPAASLQNRDQGLQCSAVSTSPMLQRSLQQLTADWLILIWIWSAAKNRDRISPELTYLGQPEMSDPCASWINSKVAYTPGSQEDPKWSTLNYLDRHTRVTLWHGTKQARRDQIPNRANRSRHEDAWITWSHTLSVVSLKVCEQFLTSGGQCGGTKPLFLSCPPSSQDRQSSQWRSCDPISQRGLWWNPEKLFPVLIMVIFRWLNQILSQLKCWSADRDRHKQTVPVWISQFYGSSVGGIKM